MTREGQDQLQPRTLVLPNIQDRGMGDHGISGMMCISGNTLMVWMGQWFYLSGSTTIRHLQV